MTEHLPTHAADAMVATAAAPDPYRDGWTAAIALARHFHTGGTPQPIHVSGVILEPGEGALVSTNAVSTRLYGGDGSYTKSGTFVLGGAAMIAGSLAATALYNKHQRNKATRDMVPTWRDASPCGVILTQKRIMISLPGVGFSSFWLGNLQELHVELDAWSLVMGWADTVPLRLQGPSTAYLGVYLTRVVRGANWLLEPAMQRLVNG